MTWFGVDVGGSAVKLGAVAPDGTRGPERNLPLPAAPRPDEVLASIAGAVRSLADELGERPRALGVGLPGLLDREAGRVRISPNLPWLQDAPVRDGLAAATGLDPRHVHLENDANVAALGEQWIGAARGERHSLTVTLGTGIGGGLVLEDVLFRGEGLAGEVGHVTVDPDGPACGCGSRGCLETLASASAAHRRAAERGLPAGAPGDLPLLCARAREHDGTERALLTEIGRDLGRGLGTVLTLLDVRCFVFCGGFAAALDLLEPGIRVGLAEWSYGERVAAVRLLEGRLGTSAGWIGAARLAGETTPPLRR